MKTSIVIFSDDFRIIDNPALFHAAEKYQNIIPVYIYDENYLGRKLGSASKIFLKNVLLSFNNLLQKEYNIKLIIKKGNKFDEINKIIATNKIDAVYFNHSYTSSEIAFENEIKKKQNIDVRSFKAKLLFDPWEIKPLSGLEYYRVFTPFSKECIKKFGDIKPIHPKPKISQSIHSISTLSAEDLDLDPPINQGNWAEDLLKNWSFDYTTIEEKFKQFVKTKIHNYKEDRNIPEKNSTSMMSPYLRFGVISPKFCLYQGITETNQSDNFFSLELLWREFAYHAMFYNQNIATIELKFQYGNFVWQENQDFFEKWTQGKTGFDIVDAGMMELWKTGVMHNRIRMITASFLIKDLLIDWKKGEHWFWNTLVDADPAINPSSWQWVFGSGFDASPYFRIFNPESQKEKFDPNSTYCKKWLRSDWKPLKIVNHDTQRKITLEKYKNL